MTEVAKLETREGYIHWKTALHDWDSETHEPLINYVSYKGKWYVPSRRHVIEEIESLAYKHSYLAEIYYAELEGDFLVVKSTEGETRSNIKYGSGLSPVEKQILKSFKDEI
jgi:hypothetical protein